MNVNPRPLIVPTAAPKHHTLPLMVLSAWLIVTIISAVWSGVPYGPHSSTMDSYGNAVVAVVTWLASL